MRRPRRRLAVHAIALAVVLLVGLALTRPGSAYSSDEALAPLQARQLLDGEGWRYEHPLGELDPEEAARPFVRAVTGTEGVAPYAKHPVYPVVLLPAVAVAPDIGAHLVSVLGAVLAGVGAALLARRFGPGLDVPTLWVTGLATPLLFDAWIPLAHTLAAATTALAVLSTLRALERPGSPWGPAVLAGVAVVAGALLRSEALLVGPALVLALGVHVLVATPAEPAVGTRARLSRAVPPAVAAAVATVVAVLVDTAASRAVLGPSVPQPNLEPHEDPGWLVGRVESIVATWFEPSYYRGDPGVQLTFLGLVLVAGGTLAWRTGRGRLGAAVLLAAAAAYGVGLATSPGGAVRGLLVASPVLVAGVVLAGRAVVATPGRLVVCATAGALLAGVAATQYAGGGGIEWGGRYFAIALPLVAPIAVASLADATHRFTRTDVDDVADAAGDAGDEAESDGDDEPDGAAPTHEPGGSAPTEAAGGRPAPVPAAAAAAVAQARRAHVVGLAALVVAAGALAWAAVDAQRTAHDAAEDVQAAVARAAAPELAEASPTGRPVVVGDNRLLPQLLYPVFDDYEWVVPQRRHVPRYLDRLATAGVGRVVVVASDPADLVGEAPGWHVSVHPAATGHEDVVVAVRRP